MHVKHVHIACTAKSVSAYKWNAKKNNNNYNSIDMHFHETNTSCLINSSPDIFFITISDSAKLCPMVNDKIA